MIGKLLGRSWGVMVMAVLFATAVNAQELASARSNSPDSKQTSERFQERTITGKVISGDNDEGLPGVNVIVKGTTTGGITDIEGNYTVTVPDDNAALIFSSVGFETIEIIVGNQSIIDVTLQADLTTLSEIVVVGYGTQEKRDVTASIASLEGEKLTSIPTGSSVDAMKGQIAGVDVTQQGGRPGENQRVLVRGRRSLAATNNPLYVVDGIPMTDGEGTIQDINPQDIASVEVLKDAAATAIYGSRGSNGVILISTKRGKAGKTNITYDGYYGPSSTNNTVDMMNAQEFADMKRESRRRDADGNAAWNGTIPEDFIVFDDAVEIESLSRNPVRGTDYQDLVLGTGYQTNHQISVNGGSESTQFNVSLGYFREQGIIESMDFERITGRINIDHKISKIFRIGMSSLTSFSSQNWGSNATFNEALANNPLGVPYDEETGDLLFLPTNDGIRTNPLSELVPGAYVDERDVTRIFSSLYIEANIIEGLKYRLNFGPDIRFRRRGVFRGSLTNSNRGGPASATYQNRQELGYTLENVLTYDKTFGEIHSLKVTALQAIQSNRTEWHNSDVSNLPYESQSFYNIGTAEVKGDLFSRLEEWQLASFMGRINYDVADKYLFQVTLRADGSSRLSEGNKWAYFPGVSAGWRIIDEQFMQNISVMNELKLRASYGEVGNTSVDPYQTQGALGRTVYAWDESPAFGYRLNDIPNPELGWEIAKTLDFGVDFGFFDGRLYGTFDWYQTNTEDLLLQRNLPYSSGYRNVLQNVGSTRNTGVELMLGANVIRSDGGFMWDIDFNISSYTEEITELALKDENGNPIDDQGNNWFIGQPIRVFYDFKKIGIWQANEVDMAKDMEQKVPGEIKLQDTNGDGVIAPDDRVILGSDVPDFYGGITNRFSWKGFDFSFFFFFKQGYMLRSNFHRDNNTLFARYNNLDVDYWTIDNPTNEYPRPNENQERPTSSTTMRYFDGSFVKLRNITLGYNFPGSITDKLRMSKLRVYAQAQNPMIWTQYDTFDPENDDEVDDSDLPTPRYFLFGINIGF
jgi:TonB-linked SusC/RagA family outer membrane protein